MRPDSNDRGELAADMAVRIIAEGGCSAVTFRAVTQAAGVTPPGVRQWFGDAESMWRRIVACCGRRWLGWILDWRRSTHLMRAGPAESVDERRVLALLPLDEEERAWTRVWLALVERSRGQTALAEVVAEVEREEVEVVGRLVDDLSQTQAEALVAQARGLRHALCAGADPMPLERAHELLTGFVAGTGLRETRSAHASRPD